MTAHHASSPLPRVELSTRPKLNPVAALYVPGAFVAVALFCWLAALVVDHPGPFAADANVMNGFIQIRTGLLTIIAQAIAVGTDPAVTAGVVIAAALWLLMRSKDRMSAAFLVGAAVATAVALEAAKLWVDRPRPPAAMQLMPETNNSFPSGHVTGVVAVFGALAMVAVLRGVRRFLVVTIWSVLVVLVVLDRLYLGVHWSSDIVGALLLGTAVLLLELAVLRRMMPTHLPKTDPVSAHHPSPGR
ncbi:phosphatase PAP2 family protein [Nakamurella sp. A5-74]|uniref:Phosphatase PAP2 family protein n=1 Tax=Nakamurella sp. A5-74 TaxID=3158264 RepID=A0AAU8DPI4_9ACTN